MKKQITIMSGLALTICCGAGAQNAQLGYQTFGPMETKAVTGSPYSATAITTFTQTLADGTHITRTIQAQLARDSEGRTRREESLNAVGPWSTGGSDKHLISISDPIAQTHYVLQPDQQVAMKAGLPTIVGPGPLAGPGITAGPGIAGISGAVAGIKVRQGFEENGVKVTTSSSDNVMWMAKEGTMMVIGAEKKPQQVEELGDQMIEGVRAHGRREKRTLAVGEIGNDRPIEVSSETWFSDELQTIVLSKRTDPRMGDSEYRLTNISRTEPAASLFEIPAGYTMRDEGKRRE
ncbi:MAG TPA: hypothetical protein VH157_00470 [Bryobacteraceae bacterium]|nr:hypothetical protein [Bryobacteraceae bacterium]